MRWILRIAAAAAPILLLPGTADAFGCRNGCGGGGCGGRPLKVDGYINWNFNIRLFGPGGGCLAGPWYSYWPYEAHFAAPAPTDPYPWWPGPSTFPPGGPTVPQTAPPTTPAANQPVGYFIEAPSYWREH
jgi:hypothetical protein